MPDGTRRHTFLDRRKQACIKACMPILHTSTHLCPPSHMRCILIELGPSAGCPFPVSGVEHALLQSSYLQCNSWYCTGRPGMTCHMGENVFISCSWQQILNLFWSSALISIRPHTKPGTSLVSTCHHFRRRAGSDAHFPATASLPRLPGFL